MKQADIKVGGVYVTLVGGNQVKVVVTGITGGTRPVYGGRKEVTRFYVKRMGTDKPLPKARTASALHPYTRPHGEFYIEYNKETERYEVLNTESSTVISSHAAEDDAKAAVDRKNAKQP
jgi:hypothetical protein